MKKILILCIALCSLMIGACSSNTKDSNDNKPNPYEDQLKVLAIGNSFSDDSVDELWKIATSWGIEDVTIGMLYIGGTSLQDHYNNILKGESGNNYTYFKYQGIHRTSRPDQTIKEGLIDEPWDVIMVQQVSGLSGVYESYNTPEPYLQTLLDYIKENQLNENGQIALNMTWAYSKTSNHHDYWRYNRDQETMYEAIVTTAQQVLNSFKDISFVIPTGTAIQNARPFIGDHHMTRDGYHLDHTTGRYIAAMTVFKAITGLDLNPIRHRTSGITIETMNLVKSAVDAAIKEPFEFTKIQ